MYFIFRAFGMPKKVASHFYWDIFAPIEIVIVFLAMIDSGFIRS